MNKLMSDTLSYIGDILSKKKISWIVGGSIVLNYYGLTEIVNDIDLIVDIKDFEKVKSIFSTIGEFEELPKKGIYKTEGYIKCKINRVDIDIMSNFKIIHYKGVYEYLLDQNSISKAIEINNVEIPLGSLEDWYEIYKVIPGREEKVQLIKEYFSRRDN